MEKMLPGLCCFADGVDDALACLHARWTPGRTDQVSSI